MHIVIYLINYDLGFAIYMYLYLGVMILLFAQCIDRDRFVGKDRSQTHEYSSG
jgi:hypothetical protein